TCVRNSLGRLRTEIIAKLSMLRVLRARPSRPQTAPQQYSVTRSCSGLVKSCASANALLTYASPSTAERISSPRWYVSRSNGLLLCNHPKPMSAFLLPDRSAAHTVDTQMDLPDLVLVHGGAHAADCWDLTVNEIHRLEPGLDVRAIDLPGRREKPADLRTATIDDWVDSVVADVDDA